MLGIMTGTPRERARAQTMAEITRIGCQQLIEHGAAGLSLRAVARELGVVSSAVYRYVASRDDLLTLLLVDAYNELGDAVDNAVAEVQQRDGFDSGRAQFRALARAVRGWAVAEPARYALLFGSPVPDYHAPAEQTVGPGTRVIVTLMHIIESSYRTGDLTQPVSIPAASLPATLRRDFDRIRGQFEFEVPDAVIARGLLVWSALFGAVSFDVFDQYGTDTFTDRGILFDHHIDMLADSLGLS